VGGMAMSKCKDGQRYLSIMREIVNISKHMEDYNLAIFTHAMDFFKECASFKKPILEHFFTSY
jgi:hypothetical protein